MQAAAHLHARVQLQRVAAVPGLPHVTQHSWAGRAALEAAAAQAWMGRGGGPVARGAAARTRQAPLASLQQPAPAEPAPPLRPCSPAAPPTPPVQHQRPANVLPLSQPEEEAGACLQRGGRSREVAAQVAATGRSAGGAVGQRRRQRHALHCARRAHVQPLPLRAAGRDHRQRHTAAGPHHQLWWPRRHAQAAAAAAAAGGAAWRQRRAAAGGRAAAGAAAGAAPVGRRRLLGARRRKPQLQSGTSLVVQPVGC